MYPSLAVLSNKQVQVRSLQKTKHILLRFLLDLEETQVRWPTFESTQRGWWIAPWTGCILTFTSKKLTYTGKQGTATPTTLFGTPRETSNEIILSHLRRIPFP